MTRSRDISRLLPGVLALAVFAETVSAQELPRRQPAAAPPPLAAPVGTVRAVPGAGLPAVLDLGLNKAGYIMLPARPGRIDVVNEDIADVRIAPNNPRQVIVLSKAIGTTGVVFIDREGRVMHQTSVRVSMDQGPLQAALRELLPDEKIDVSVFGGNIFLKGNVRSAAAATTAMDIADRFVTGTASVTNMMQVVGSQQVILQVKVAEMDRAIRKNLDASTTGDFGATRGISFTTTSPTPTLTAFASGTLSTRLRGLGAVTFSALERQSLVKTLAEPTLTAVSGQAATFLSGGEIPVPVGVDQNGNAIIEFREYGIRLNFTPTVLDKGRISLQIGTEISAIDSTNTVTLSGLSVNGFTSKRTDTTVDLPSGGSLMMSGLLQDNIDDTISGFPFLKDLPVLGALFRSTQFQRDETELVITVTAYLVKAAGNNAALAVPTDGFEPASDIDIYLLGRLHRKYGKGERPFWKDPLSGPFGYILK